MASYPSNQSEFKDQLHQAVNANFGQGGQHQMGGNYNSQPYGIGTHNQQQNMHQQSNFINPTISYQQGPGGNNLQNSEWGNMNLQQAIRQDAGSRGGNTNNFGNDCVFNNSHYSGNRIKNKGFTVFENNTPLTNKIGDQMNLGSIGAIMPTLFPNPSTKYKILSAVDTSKALDVTSVSDEKKKLKKGQLIIWEYHGGPNQQFYILPCQGKKVRLINAANGYSVEIPNSSTQDGSPTHVNPNNNTQNEEFELIEYSGDKTKKNFYRIKTFCGKVLDCENQRESNGTNVIQWSQNNGKNQLWWITPA